MARLKHGKLLDLYVTLSGFGHDHPRDVDLLLVAPNGRSAIALSDIGGNDPLSNLTLVLDDQAALPLLPLPPLSPFISGIYRPTNLDVAGETDSFPAPGGASPNVALSTFHGINPNGAWKLFVVDDASSDTGFMLGGWSLTIKARVRV